MRDDEPGPADARLHAADDHGVPVVVNALASMWPAIWASVGSAAAVGIIQLLCEEKLTAAFAGLGIARLLMGWPLTFLAALVSFWAIREADKRGKLLAEQAASR